MGIFYDIRRYNAIKLKFLSKRPIMISVVLPTYNEKENIIALINAVETGLPDHELDVIVIDDNSADGTFDLVKTYADDHKHVSAILREHEKGFRTALQKGIDLSKGHIIIWMDCDFSHPPSLIPRMVEAIEKNGFDVVVPSRFIAGSDDLTALDAPLPIKLQKKLSLGLNGLCSRLLDDSFHDWTSGFVAIRSKLIKDHLLKGDFCEYFMELISYLILQQAKILEIPYTSPPRRAGETKSAPSMIKLFTQGIKYIRMLSLILRQKKEHARTN